MSWKMFAAEDGWVARLKFSIITGCSISVTYIIAEIARLRVFLNRGYVLRVFILFLLEAGLCM